MEKIGKFVKDIERMKKVVDEVINSKEEFIVDFFNIEVVFVGKIDEELCKFVWIFGMMNWYWFVGIGLKLGLVVIRMYLFFVEGIVKNIIYE